MTKAPLKNLGKKQISISPSSTVGGSWGENYSSYSNITENTREFGINQFTRKYRQKLAWVKNSSKNGSGTKTKSIKSIWNTRN